jgi:hypothetical protein
MKKNFDTNRRRGNEGYALVFVLFLMALVIIGATTATLDQLTEGRREKEAVMIWRGKQYQRAIGLFYKKLGRFPSSVDDLVKVQNGEERFLREAYKNPMNKDGTWRFIYVTPAGQLIGSVQYVSLQQMAFLDQQRKLGLVTGATGTASADADNSDNGSGSDSGAQNGSNQTLSNIQLGGINPSNLNLNNLSPSQLQALQSQLQGLSPQQLQALASQFQGQIPPQLQSQLQQMLGQSSPQTGGSSFSTQPGANPGGGMAVQESSGSSDSTDSNGQVIGGFIIGVAGMQDKRSIKIYKGGATYKRWEFIFNPLEQVTTIGTTSSAPTNLTGSQPGGTSQTPNPMQPQPPNPPQQPQIPQQPQ